MSTPQARLGQLWSRMSGSVVGRWSFSRIFGWFVPYSATVGARILHLEPGLCRTELPDRRRVRNHLDSIHAVALINLGELTSGLAMTMALPSDVRGIVTELLASYHKKARGTLYGEARVTVPAVGDAPVDTRVATIITDQLGEQVCRVETIWRLERRRSGSAPA